MNSTSSTRDPERSVTSDHWPPTGYSALRVYMVDECWGLVIAVLLVPPVVVLVVPPLKSGTTVLTVWAETLGQAGLANHPFLYVALVVGGLYGWIVVSSITIIAVHEGVHYVTGHLRGLNPTFEWATYFGIPSPSVVAYNQGIQRWEKLLMLVAPFVGLSLVCGLVVWATSGVLAATAAIMFAVNVVPSGMDLYNVGRLARLPRGTLFANFDTEKGLRTEYVVHGGSDHGEHRDGRL